MAWPNHASNSQQINTHGNINGNINGNSAGNNAGNSTGKTNGNGAFHSRQTSESRITNGIALAAELAGSAAITSPPSSQLSVDSSSGRPAFKNPLGAWKSPSPPAKRQKTTGHTGSAAAAAAAAPTPISASVGVGGGLQAPSSQPFSQSSPLSLPPKSPQPLLHKLKSPGTFSPGQPTPGATSTPARAPAQTPIRPPVRPVDSASTAAKRRISAPVKVREAAENNRIVLIIDSDDDDDDNDRVGARNTGPTPVPVPVVPTAQASALPKHPLNPPVTPIPLPLYGRLSGSPSVTKAFIMHTANAITSRPKSPFEPTPVKRRPSDDSIININDRLHITPQARPAASQGASFPPATPILVTPARPVTTTGPTTYGAPAPAPPPSAIAAYVPSDIASPVIHRHEPRSTRKPIEEHLEPAVNVDITPVKSNTPMLVSRKQSKGQRKGQQPKTHQHFVRYAHLTHRPYLRSSHRRFVAQNYHELPNLLGLPLTTQQRGLSAAAVADPSPFQSPSPSVVIHVDFLPDEIHHLLDVVRFVHTNAGMGVGVGVGRSSKQSVGQKHSSAERELKSLLRRQPPEFEQLVVNSTTPARLPGRSQKDIFSFLIDARAGSINYNDGNSGSVSSSGSYSSNKSRSSLFNAEALAPALGGPSAIVMKRSDRAAYSLQEARAERATKLNTFIMMREVAGQRPVQGRSRQLLNFTNAVRTVREDGLRLRNEWTNLAGDVTTVSWTSKDAFICGTTTHMDERNHQYNRQGNLALGSVSAGTLRGYPDHRIVRTRAITTLTNPTNPTQQQQSGADDPWLYTSVVSSDYDATHDLAFTSGFDNNVIVWKVSKDGTSMARQGVWRHEGKVNFVVASSGIHCLVATAADVPVQAVRVYRLPSVQERMQGNRQISYKMFSCSRIVDLEGRPVLTDKWAYFPAAIRWGLSETTRHLLLVGYSPRGLDINAEDDDIPEDRRNSGELCLWDGLTGEPWRILGASSQNVFEVAWHPTQACFVAATAPTVHQALEQNARTQIRIFRLSVNSEYGGRAYSEVQTLDCYADDINELALRPNSFGFLYVAAGCTNGHTYVWDTSQGDYPIYDLGHDACIEEQAGEKISVEDTGVKFVAWGETPDRLYTGSSDGAVKVWNIRTHGGSRLSPAVRNLLQCPAPVSFGAFSPDKSKLAIGDASGRVSLLSVEDGVEEDDEDGSFLSDEEEQEDDFAGTKKTPQAARVNGNLQHSHPAHLAFKHHPPEVIRHATPPPPSSPPPTAGQNPLQQTPPSAAAITSTATTTATATAANGDEEDENVAIATSRAFLSSGQLVIVPDPTVGAVKGPNYADTNLFCTEYHQDKRPELPLLAEYERVQQENQPRANTSPSRQRALRSVYPDVAPATIFGSSASGVSVLGAPDPLQALQRQNTIRRVQVLHARNIACDLDVNSLPVETREALELADRAALLHIDDDDYDYGFDYEEVPDTV
ncbi:hypothetical protein SPBR_01211 [Sporothrix brasiliensis 5110]|uniref:Uncharacterized protein n=1 Tax=Sporothrix brasiliensis 5110 TaxID=1398154 RepID=A0A0C2FKF1_9PEZI|nr:uncharacterized protein SPBR_01211 [Sporothrix brasiliensis 5110]KIH91548.1 hypothetical protein SPBR_01211 [Sporothrix brasiliensis 5110]